MDAVNDVLFSKTVSNKFITLQDVVCNMLLCCNSITEFVMNLNLIAKFDVSRLKPCITSKRKVGIGSCCTRVFVFNIEILLNNIDRGITTL